MRGLLILLTGIYLLMLSGTVMARFITTTLPDPWYAVSGPGLIMGTALALFGGMEIEDKRTHGKA